MGAHTYTGVWPAQIANIRLFKKKTEKKDVKLGGGGSRHGKVKGDKYEVKKWWKHNVCTHEILEFDKNIFKLIFKFNFKKLRSSNNSKWDQLQWFIVMMVI